MIFGTKTLKIQPIISLSEKLENEDEIMSVSVDQKGINVLIIHSVSQYKTENGMFAFIKSDKPKNYTFIRFDLKGNEIFKTLIKDEYYNFHYVNFLPTKEILLVCGRSRFKNENEIDKNARVYNLKGKLLRDFIAGDGIQDIQIDNDGNIWASYFDEGIFGNYGWNEPIGTPGLICWNKNGQKIWEFKPTNGLDYMADCYAMNIDSDNNTWFYYYAEFPLVKLNNSKQIKFWNTDIRGSSSLNISGNKVLMADGYYEDNFILFEVKGNKLKKINKVEFKNEENQELNKRNYITSFGSNIGFLKENKIYLTNMNVIK
ncbi:hypothetical protein F7018_08005 [Tenacibaculum aiptasiae]|uniref:6-bladed beta-propeller n=1 Tax=Tenacibaculum aiptasiae TaxID=426481 RepID=A0A7J5AM03_9FLAO|nr:hypothetical protein [Tenacibaculum aiptasiae]KAB1158553.1 hypothetical protein F7018_08005 [Tenacibaculum aiptasiae]